MINRISESAEAGQAVQESDGAISATGYNRSLIIAIS